MECLDLDQPLKGYKDFRKGVESLQHGDLDAASLLFNESREWAVLENDVRLEGRARSYGWAVVIARGEFDQPISELRDIFNLGDPENCFLAAYNLARAFECRKEYRKGQFYAKLAFQHAETIDRSEWLGWSHNQLGNFSMALGETAIAMKHYRSSMEHINSNKLGWLALVHQNIGYGHLISGNTQQGFRHLFHSLRTVRQLNQESSLIHLDLAWGFLDIGRPRLAAKHSQKALDLAEIEGIVENTKNALLLLGQAARELALIKKADQCYSQLETFYPGQEHWITMVKNINVNALISLRA